MKTRFTVFCLLIPLMSFAQNADYHVNAIAFYNLENLFDTIDDPNKNDDEFTLGGAYHYADKVYKAKLHKLATVIQKLGVELVPDGVAFIGVAEVENTSVLADLAIQPEIKGRNYQNLCFYGPDARGINTGFLYNPKYFRPISTKTYRVDISKSDEKAATRDVLFIAGEMSGDTVYVLVNHWPSRYGGEAASAPKRVKAAKVNRTIVDSLLNINAHSKIFIIGDFNDDPTNESIVNVLDATGDKKNVTTRRLYNPWVKFYKKGIGTLGYQDAWNLFDQIIISKNILDDKSGWRYYKSEVFNRDFLIEKYGQYKGYPKRAFVNSTWNDGYSDHLPIVMYLIRPVK